MNSIEDLKQEIEQRAGIPASLLNGETIEENIAQAKALLAYKKQVKADEPQNNAERFADWLKSSGYDNSRDAAGIALGEIEKAALVEAGVYPAVPDGGEVTEIATQRPTSLQFSDWLGSRLAFNPSAGSAGWHKLT